MIGDKVVKPSGHIRTMGREEFSNDDAWFEDTKPIPLTPEILEKNGWKHNGIFMDKWIGEKTFFSWSDRFGAELYLNNYHICDCEYVHTLQHALRLRGFDVLADNFKV